MKTHTEIAAELESTLRRLIHNYRLPSAYKGQPFRQLIKAAEFQLAELAEARRVSANTTKGE
jgi:hypothetical protein